MENIVGEIAKQVPSLLVLVFVVRMFVQHIERTSAAFRETVKEIHTEHMLARAESQQVLRDNTNSARQNTEAVTELTTAVAQLKARV